MDAWMLSYTLRQLLGHTRVRVVIEIQPHDLKAESKPNEDPPNEDPKETKEEVSWVFPPDDID